MSTRPRITIPVQRPKATVECMVVGCEKPVFTRGWCQAHYRRWYRYGDPEGFKPRPRKERHWEDRWNARVRVKRNGCHEWLGQLWKGVPMFQAPKDPANEAGPKQRVAAYRWIWMLRHPDVRLRINERLIRTCGNNLCVNPEHVQRCTKRDLEELKEQALENRRRYDRKYRQSLRDSTLDDERLVV